MSYSHKDVIDLITRKMLVQGGYTPEEDPIEWDPEREDSQYSILYEMVETVVSSYQEEEETTSNKKFNVTVSNCSFIFMDAGVGNPAYVRDVREWLRVVEQAGISDDTEIDGRLHLTYDVEPDAIERIECGDCGTKDVLLTLHKCNLG